MPCTDDNKCTKKTTQKFEPNSLSHTPRSQLEQAFSWMKLREWKRTNTTLYAFQFIQVYRRTDKNGILELNENFTYQYCVY